MSDKPIDSNIVDETREYLPDWVRPLIAFKRDVAEHLDHLEAVLDKGRALPRPLLFAYAIACTNCQDVLKEFDELIGRAVSTT